MKEWFSIAELAAQPLPDLPLTEKSLDNMARAKWRDKPALARRVPGKTKPVWQYHISVLPQSAQARLAMILSGSTEGWELARKRKNELWKRFERLSNDHRAICAARLAVLTRVEELASRPGINRTTAIAIATSDAGVQKSAYYEWRKQVEGLDADDWLAALAPSSPAADGIAPSVVECHPDAWAFLKSDYLRPEKPAFSACYRRMLQAAAISNWAPVPSERSLRRRLETEVGKAVLVVTREGKEKAKQLFPAQRRTRADMHAMQAVNMDGHKLDLFVRLPGRKQPTRVFLIGIQDLYSGKILAWRLSEAETWDAARLVIGDMVEAYGIPESIDLDNGRAFASKKISGGAKTRYRNKINPDDPEGLLVTLGIKPRFVLPYSGQSKPIERAWRDLAENISKHPVCSGAYTGPNPQAKPDNYMKTAIALDDLKRLVAIQIAEHNARPGRNTETTKGRSFDETFAESMASPSTIVRVPSKAQRFLWLLTAEAIKTHKANGEIRYLGNRYWNIALNQWMGKKVTIRFDPDALHQPIKVYDLQNRFICEAECIENAGHHSSEEGRIHSKRRGDVSKANAALAEAHRQLTPLQLGEILERGRRTVEQPEKIRPAVTRLVTRAQESPAPVEMISDQHFEDSFSRALGMVQGNAVIAFPTGNIPPATVSGGGNHEPNSSAYGSGKKKGGRKTAR